MTRCMLEIFKPHGFKNYISSLSFIDSEQQFNTTRNTKNTETVYKPAKARISSSVIINTSITLIYSKNNDNFTITFLYYPS